MIVSTEKKFVFTAIPKTGTTSIENVLRKYCDEDEEDVLVQHQRLKNVEHLLDESYYKFCFFRNPWDRMVSWYHFSVKQGGYFFNHPHDKLSFDEWLARSKVTGTLKKRQTHWIESRGKLIPDVAIYKFEEMDDAWKHICETLDISGELPHINKSKHKHYSEYYTEESKRIVAIHCYGEIKMMNYKFEKGEIK